MRVVLLSPLPPPSGGMARWTELYLSECKKHSIIPSVVNTSISDRRAQQKDRSFGVLDEVIRSKRIVSNLKKNIQAESPEIIHICSPCSRFGLLRDWICCLVARRIPVVFHCHCNIEDQARTRISRYILRKIAKKSKKVIVLNESSKKVIDDIEPRKTILIPNFIEDKKVKKEHSISEHISTVIYVGHVKIKKGISEIFSVALTKPEIQFQVIGPVQELPETIEKPDNVCLVGEISHEQVSKYLEKADVFMFPSYTEGFANVMLEAMAEGLPIIASNVGANRDMIEDNGGIIVPVKDYKSLQEALVIMEDSSVRAKMSSWNIEKVRTQYVLSQVLPLIRKCYEGE